MAFIVFVMSIEYVRVGTISPGEGVPGLSCGSYLLSCSDFCSWVMNMYILLQVLHDGMDLFDLDSHLPGIAVNLQSQ